MDILAGAPSGNAEESVVAYEIVETCIGCTACTNRCPTNAIWGERNTIHYIDPALCIDCGACGAVCPVECILDDDGDICRKFAKKEWPKAVVDADKCIGSGCEICINVCPFEALELDFTDQASDFFGQAVVIEKNCTGCRLCEQSCGWDAVHIFPLRDELKKLHYPDDKPTPGQEKFLRSRA